MSGTQLVLMAIVMGLMYWIARGMIGGYFAFFFIASPIVVGVVAGLIYGDLTNGLIIGGGIAAAFAGIIAPGGNLPTDSALAATEKGNLAGITRCAVIYPPLIEIPLLFLPVFLIVMFGQDAMLAFMNTVPSWVMHGLEVAGGVMPAIGFALIMNMIGKPRLIPYTFIGFIFVRAVGLNTLTTGVLAACIAVLIVMEKREKEVA